MPTRTIHCSICRKAISGYDFPERMKKLRHHYKISHPTEFRKWGRRNLVVMNPLLETIGTAAITGAGLGLGFKGVDWATRKLIRKNPVIRGKTGMPRALELRIEKKAHKYLKSGRALTINEGIELAMREPDTWKGYEEWKNPTKPHTEVVVSRLPKCDFCGKQAQYDGKTVMGPWANMCPTHFRMYGRGLGLGKGQKLVLRE